MTVAALFASHTPLMDYHAPAPEVANEVATCLAEARAWVAAYQPELVIACGPDHYNGFFYRLMPSFCIGTAAESVGDWNTPAGPLPVAAELAERCVESVHAAGVDVAISYHMDVDHGVTQLMKQMFDWSTMPPVVPVFVNCAAAPRPPLARVMAFGRAIGAFVAKLDCRVLLTASGGISHDPPIPTLAGAPAPVRERLIMGGALSAEARAARQQRVLSDAALQVSGESDRTPLNPAWDQAFLDNLRNDDEAAILAMDDDSITREGGCGGHEIRAWIAMAAAARVAGLRRFDLRYYRAIAPWVAGYAVMTADA
ncbi:MAG: 3-carboxyethylcatechol 2,3-dioxygenase [Proteobacteria bacterium]|nr:3-carboxyethylcatechol 2,3-dioxygenase [Pseudomonadota bacterium]